jgi:hypothetical protein
MRQIRVVLKKILAFRLNASSSSRSFDGPMNGSTQILGRHILFHRRRLT